MTTTDGERVGVDLDLFEENIKREFDIFYRTTSFENLEIDFNTINVSIPNTTNWLGDTLQVAYTYSYCGNKWDHCFDIKIL